MSSYWLEWSKDQESKNKIDGDYEADVSIIGAGIFGLTVGYYLSKKGLKVIIIDKNQIGEKTSGNTTAKITFGHNLIYDYLLNSYGKEFALKYLEANEQAILNIKNIIDEENIDCDFENRSNYIYTTNKNEIDKIQKEVDAINTLKRRWFCTICYRLQITI